MTYIGTFVIRVLYELLINLLSTAYHDLDIQLIYKSFINCLSTY